MILRYDEGRDLADIAYLCNEFAKDGRVRSPVTIRKHCKPVRVDGETGLNLYDVDEVKAILDTVPTRRTTRRKR